MAKIVKRPAIEIFRGNTAACARQPVKDRQFVIDTENHVFYIDIKNKRMLFGKDYGDEFYNVYGRIKEIEDRIGSIESTILTEEEINELVNLKIENVINNETEISNKINGIVDKLSEVETQTTELKTEVEKLSDEIIKVVETKQDKIINFSDVLKADQWNQFDDGDEAINEYYYTSDKIPENCTQITIVPEITTGEQYEIIADAVLFSSIEHTVRDGENYYVIRAKKIPAGDINVFISVIR